jgi:hypothetical protein
LFDGAELAGEDVLGFVFSECDFDVSGGAVSFVDFFESAFVDQWL